MKTKRPLPPNRSYEQVRHHYEVEKAIARRLMAATREQRKIIYKDMYDELFREVPDHPRLSRTKGHQASQKSKEMNWAWLKQFVNESTIYLEFAPGTCELAMAVAAHVEKAYGVDISDQRTSGEADPPNFDLKTYDGYNLQGIPDDSIDLIFSNQLIEHLHPEDTRLHFELAYRLLKPGGIYAFRTPHALTGPHDISKYFSDEPEGFHLKEWTYREIQVLLELIGYSSFWPYRLRGSNSRRLSQAYCRLAESALRRFPRRRVRRLAGLLLPQVAAVAVK